MKDWMWIVIGFLPGVIAGGILVYLYSRSGIYSILASEKYKYLNDLKLDTRQHLLVRKYFKYIGVVAKLKQSKDQKKDIIENNNRESGYLKRLNEKLTKENERLEEIVTELKITADEKTLTRDRSRRRTGQIIQEQ